MNLSFTYQYLWLLVAWCMPVFIQAQDIPVGSWRTHLAYTNGQQIALARDKVYCSSENGLFFYNTQTETLTTLGRNDGLSDTGIADLAYHEPTETLVIAYQNGNIDLWREDEVINVRSLLNSSKPNTEIASIYLHEETAYFATAFGGFSFNLRQLTPENTYDDIGGLEAVGRGFTVFERRLYLNTNMGVYSVSMEASVNQQDPNNWSKLPNIASAPSHFTSNEEALYYAIPEVGVFRYEETGSTVAEIPGSGQVSFLKNTSDGIAVGATSGVFFIQNGTVNKLEEELIRVPNDIAVFNGGRWLADGEAGLLHVAEGGTERLTPSGTLGSDAFRLFADKNRVIAVAGGFEPDRLQPLGRVGSFYVFDEGAWQNFSSNEQVGVVQIPDIQDITSAVYVPSEGRTYFGSMGGGVISWEENTTDFHALASSPRFVSSLAVDDADRLWACDTQNGLYRQVGSAWERVQGITRPAEIVIDPTNTQWIRLADGGLIIRNGNQQRTLRHSPGQGDLRGSRVRSLAVDRLGSVLAGTNDGLTEFFDPFFTLSGEDGSTIFSSEGSPMNQGETVTAIAIDGGNRKWIGTENGGVWLYDTNNRLVYNFTAENSPLLSNIIYSIAIQPTSGEVFFATSQGIISFRGTSVAGSTSFEGAKVFPNPVPPNYAGLISIDGLVGNAQVRITDAGGRLVWKGQAAGGRATWDGQNYQGEKVKAGIYFIFAANADGAESFAGKIALMH